MRWDPGPFGWLTIHHVSFLHVPLGSSTLSTGSPWFRGHDCHLQTRGVVSQSVTSPQSLLIPSLNSRLPLSSDSPASQAPLLPASAATNLLTLPVEVHERMAGLGDIWHSHSLVHPIDVKMQPPRAV